MHENVDIILQAKFTGIKGIKKATELSSDSEIVMTRRTYLSRLNAGNNHFYTAEDYLSIINDPDYILLGRKSNHGHKVQLLSKRRNKSTVGLVIIYTDIPSGRHSIASGFEITSTKLIKYLNKFQIIWEKS